MTIRRKFLTVAALMAAATPPISALTVAGAEEGEVQMMFVQTAGDRTLRLVNVNQQTMYFSDRPDSRRVRLLRTALH